MYQEFARTILPPNTRASIFRDEAREMLHVIADDIETSQTAVEQKQKSRGERFMTVAARFLSLWCASPTRDRGIVRSGRNNVHGALAEAATERRLNL